MEQFDFKELFKHCKTLDDFNNLGILSLIDKEGGSRNFFKKMNEAVSEGVMSEDDYNVWNEVINDAYKWYYTLTGRAFAITK